MTVPPYGGSAEKEYQENFPVRKELVLAIAQQHGARAPKAKTVLIV